MPIQEPLPQQLKEEDLLESPPPDDTQTHEDAAPNTEPPQVARSTEGLTVGGTPKKPPTTPEDASEPDQQNHENRQRD